MLTTQLYNTVLCGIEQKENAHTHTRAHETLKTRSPPTPNRPRAEEPATHDGRTQTAPPTTDGGANKTKPETGKDHGQKTNPLYRQLTEQPDNSELRYPARPYGTNNTINIK